MHRIVKFLCYTHRVKEAEKKAAEAKKKSADEERKAADELKKKRDAAIALNQKLKANAEAEKKLQEKVVLATEEEEAADAAKIQADEKAAAAHKTASKKQAEAEAAKKKLATTTGSDKDVEEKKLERLEKELAKDKEELEDAQAAAEQAEAEVRSANFAKTSAVLEIEQSASVASAVEQELQKARKVLKNAQRQKDEDKVRRATDSVSCAEARYNSSLAEYLTDYVDVSNGDANSVIKIACADRTQAGAYTATHLPDSPKLLLVNGAVRAGKLSPTIIRMFITKMLTPLQCEGLVLAVTLPAGKEAAEYSLLCSQFLASQSPLQDVKPMFSYLTEGGVRRYAFVACHTNARQTLSKKVHRDDRGGYMTSGFSITRAESYDDEFQQLAELVQWLSKPSDVVYVLDASKYCRAGLAGLLAGRKVFLVGNKARVQEVTASLRAAAQLSFSQGAVAQRFAKAGKKTTDPHVAGISTFRTQIDVVESVQVHQ